MQNYFRFNPGIGKDFSKFIKLFQSWRNKRKTKIKNYKRTNQKCAESTAQNGVNINATGVTHNHYGIRLDPMLQ